MTEENESLKKQLEDNKKERNRLEELTRDQDCDIQLLLQGGSSFHHIRKLLADLKQGLASIEDSQEEYGMNSKQIKGFMIFLKEFESSSMSTRSKRGRSTKKKPGDRSESSEVDENISPRVLIKGSV